jgi:hypothetical protein
VEDISITLYSSRFYCSCSYSGRILLRLNPTRIPVARSKMQFRRNMDHWINSMGRLTLLSRVSRGVDGDGSSKKMASWLLSLLLFVPVCGLIVESRSCNGWQGVARCWCVGTCLLSSGESLCIGLTVVSKCESRLFQGYLESYELEDNRP